MLLLMAQYFKQLSQKKNAPRKQTAQAFRGGIRFQTDEKKVVQNSRAIFAGLASALSAHRRAVALVRQ